MFDPLEQLPLDFLLDLELFRLFVLDLAVLLLNLLVPLDLFFDLVGVSLDHARSLLFKFEEGLPFRPLLLEQGLELGLFHPGLLLQPSLFLELLLQTGLCQLIVLFGTQFGLLLFLFSGSPLISLGRSLCS